jgi:hypothetical protein
LRRMQGMFSCPKSKPLHTKNLQDLDSEPIEASKRGSLRATHLPAATHSANLMANTPQSEQLFWRGIFLGFSLGHCSASAHCKHHGTQKPLLSIKPLLSGILIKQTKAQQHSTAPSPHIIPPCPPLPPSLTWPHPPPSVQGGPALRCLSPADTVTRKSRN